MRYKFSKQPYEGILLSARIPPTIYWRITYLDRWF